MTVDEAQRHQAGWLTLETLLEEVHGRASDSTPEQIEAEISAARTEVKKARYDRRSH